MRDPIRKISIMGCGWLGLALGERLVRAGFEVHGSTTSGEKLSVLRSAGIRPYLIRAGDELEGTEDTFFRTDLLILNIPPGRKRPDVADRYPGEIRQVVDKALAAGTRRLIFISSTSVYPNTNGIVSEKETARVKQGSGLALTRCEQYLQQLPGWPVTILRLGGLVGGDRKAGRFLAGKKDLSNGKAPVNMLHREDAIGLILRIIALDHFGVAYNACADGHPSRRDFYRTQALKEGLEPPTFAGEQLTSYKIIANDLIKEQLDYTFIYPDPMEF